MTENILYQTLSNLDFSDRIKVEVIIRVLSKVPIMASTYIICI